MRPLVAIVYANLKGNLGDFAILHSMLSDIGRKTPDADIHVYSQPFVSVDASRLKAFQLHAPPFQYKGTMYADPSPINPSTIRTLRAIGALRWYQARRTARLARLATRDFGKAFSQYAAIYVAGGAQWTGVNSGVSMFANLRAMASSNKTIRSYPVSVSNSVLKLNSPPAIAEDLRKVEAPLIVRDSQTRDLLRQIGLDPVLAADCVFALPDPSGNVPRTGQPLDRMLFVLTSQMTEQIEHALSVASVAGFKPALLSTCDIEDGPQQREIAERMGVEYMAPATWQDVVREMSSCSAIITNRLHGLILASFTRACVIPLIDRSKVRGVSRDALLPSSIERLGELTADQIAASMRQRDEAVERLKSYRMKAQQSQWSPIGGSNIGS